jgi:hypothetical protein
MESLGGVFGFVLPLTFTFFENDIRLIMLVILGCEAFALLCFIVVVGYKYCAGKEKKEDSIEEIEEKK